MVNVICKDNFGNGLVFTCKRDEVLNKFMYIMISDNLFKYGYKIMDIVGVNDLVEEKV